MIDVDPRKSLMHLHLHLSGPASLECRGCQGTILPGIDMPGISHPAPIACADQPPLPLECIIQAVNEALPLGLQQVRLCGEDTFHYPDWDALLAYLEKQPLHVVVETTGSGLTPARAARLARLPQLMVVFGWTGAAEADPNGSVEAIRLLSAAGIPLHMVVPVTRQMIGRIPAIIHAAEEAGAKSVRFTSPPPPVAFNGAANGAASALSVEEVIALGRKVEREMTKTTRLRLLFDQPPVFRGLFPQARVEGQGYCASLNRLSLLPDGRVALCGAVETIPDLVFGRIGADTLESIWNSNPVLLNLRAGMPLQLQGICAHCIMKTACFGYCIAENYLRSGSFFGPNWFCQSADNIGLFPAGRIIENSW